MYVAAFERTDVPIGFWLITMVSGYLLENSSQSDDLPLPATPVIAVSTPFGISALTSGSVAYSSENV